jgi:hypothetical protein
LLAKGVSAATLSATRHEPVNASLTTAIISACLLAAVGIGMWFRRFLPEAHLSPDGRDNMKLAMGLVATMAALLLGLLVSSAKTSYDTTCTQVMEKASKYRFLDRVLELYGPQAAEVRGELHLLIEAETRRLWPDDAHGPAQSESKSHEMGNAFYLALLRLETHDDTERALKVQAASLAVELGQLLSLMQAESATSISKPILVVVVLWLMTIFVGFSLIAPPNATAGFALIASALCAAGAFFLILELDRPFDGLLRISSEPMLNVLRHPGK